MYDIIIKNGSVIDGSGSPMFAGDVGIKEGVIEKVGELSNERARFLIDARGYYVTPGFIDIANHSDVYLRVFKNPDLQSLLYQGITTIIGGNCGVSLAPLANQNVIQSVQKYADVRSVNINWMRTGELLDLIEKNRLAVNFGTLVGHTTLRRGIVGNEVRGLTASEMKSMKKMLRDALKEGALGMSSGLIYSHAKIAPMGEIMELTEVVKDYGGVYATHVRGEAEDLLESVEEAINVAGKTGVKLQISHLKVVAKKNWPLMEEAIGFIETARMGGLDVNFDVFPYTITGSVLYTLLPDWVSEGGKGAMLQRLKDPQIRSKVAAELRERNINLEDIIISISPLDKKLTRRRIGDIAQIQSKSPEEVIIDILVAGEGRVIVMMDVLSEANMVKAIQNPFSIISTNGAGYDENHANSGELVHPRNFGSFARVFSFYVREKNKISWEEAVHKMTGKPAQKYELKKRGLIKKGYFADVAVIDPNEVQDLATPEDPYHYSKGVKSLLVNGEIVLENGHYNGKRAGQVIRRESRGWF